MIDTSCGDWYWMKFIQSKFCDYTGIDVVPSVIENNKKKYSNEKTRFICMDIVSYLKTLPSKSVDLILCRHTCEHLPITYIKELIQECKRVTKYLLLTTKKTSSDEKCNQEIVLGETSYRPINLDLDPFLNILNQHHVGCIYDGPASKYDPQMFLYVYLFH
jgi:ubiquinone/menaquinone biosynthesis C-methylase UbiE